MLKLAREKPKLDLLSETRCKEREIRYVNFIDLVARFAWQQWDSFIDYASARLANVKNIIKKKKSQKLNAFGI